MLAATRMIEGFENLSNGVGAFHLTNIGLSNSTAAVVHAPDGVSRQEDARDPWTQVVHQRRGSVLPPAGESSLPQTRCRLRAPARPQPRNTAPAARKSSCEYRFQPSTFIDYQSFLTQV